MACAQLLWDRGLIASDRHAHTRTRPGTSIFINVEDLSRASVLYNAILYKNGEAAAMAVRWGARVSDNAYVLLYGDRKSRREVTRLIPVSESWVLVSVCEWVSCVCQVSLNHTQMMQIPANSHSSPYIRTHIHTHSPSHILTHLHTLSLAHSHSHANMHAGCVICGENLWPQHHVSTRVLRCHWLEFSPSMVPGGVVRALVLATTSVPRGRDEVTFGFLF